MPPGFQPNSQGQVLYAPGQGPINEQVPELDQMPMVTPEVEGSQGLPLGPTNQVSEMELQASWSGLDPGVLEGLGKALGMAFDQKQGTVRALSRTQLEGLTGRQKAAKHAEFPSIAGFGGLLGAREKVAKAVSPCRPSEGTDPLKGSLAEKLFFTHHFAHFGTKYSSYAAPEEAAEKQANLRRLLMQLLNKKKLWQGQRLHSRISHRIEGLKSQIDGTNRLGGGYGVPVPSASMSIAQQLAQVKPLPAEQAAPLLDRVKNLTGRQTKLDTAGFNQVNAGNEKDIIGGLLPKFKQANYAAPMGNNGVPMVSVGDSMQQTPSGEGDMSSLKTAPWSVNGIAGPLLEAME